MMFLFGLIIGIGIGYTLASLACGKFISPLEALMPKRGRGARG